jgi:hypothetical protein
MFLFNVGVVLITVFSFEEEALVSTKNKSLFFPLRIRAGGNGLIKNFFS